MFAKIRLLNEKELNNLSKESQFLYNVSLKQGIGKQLLNVKKGSADFIIKNRNPSQPWKQKTSSSRVTSRTGAMLRGIIEGKTKQDIIWQGLSKNTTKTNPSILKTFNGKMIRTGNNIEAQWTIYIRDNSASLKPSNVLTKSAEKGTKKENLSKEESSLKLNKKQARMRYMWEVRGRKYIEPSHRREKNKLIGLLTKSFDKNLINKLGLK